MLLIVCFAVSSVSAIIVDSAVDNAVDSVFCVSPVFLTITC